jgi:hypothetical protein
MKKLPITFYVNVIFLITWSIILLFVDFKTDGEHTRALICWGVFFIMARIDLLELK